MRIAQIAMALLLVIAVFSSRADAIDPADYWVRASTAITLNAVAELEALVAAHPDLCTDNRPDTTEPLLVYAASCKNGAESVQTLLKLGAKPNQFDSRGDHYAIQTLFYREDTQSAELLLNAGAKVDACGKHSLPAIFQAARYCNAGLVKVLLKHGSTAKYTQEISPYPRGEKLQTTALHYSMQNHVEKPFNIDTLREVVKSLIEAKVSVNHRANFDRVPLHVACEFEFLEGAELLLGIPEIDVNAVDEFGKTPLHIVADVASQKKIDRVARTKLADLLIAQGADSAKRDKSSRTGATAYEVAQRYTGEENRLTKEEAEHFRGN